MGEKREFEEFEIKRMKEKVDVKIEREEDDEDIGIGKNEIGFENKVKGVWSEGKKCMMVKVKNMIEEEKV